MGGLRKDLDRDPDGEIDAARRRKTTWRNLGAER